ncbi:MAG: trypsin-like peptidase domain-containing protein [Elusimicrobia bacterium]|nr:trypsin-like peptidase domain-containing protein [Elusimicrobiota bacterium]
MNKLSRSVSILAAAAALLPSFANAGVKSIYGDDNRLDYFEAPAAMRELADSVVSLWPSRQVKLELGEYKLATISFGEALNLCPGEKFREQPVGAFCSGTLVGEDIVMTAGHCITDEAKCADTRFVFGYNIDTDGGKARTAVTEKDIYGCKSIIKRDLDKQASGLIGTGWAILNALLNRAGPDYALVQLDRKVEGRKPLPVNREKDLRAGTKIFVIGHPVGLPVKVAGEASVRDAGRKAFFTTDLDTFGGNSGSAVFNASTNKIEGILVRGGTDFVDSPAGCKVQLKSGQNEGRGEAVTKISMLQKHIPEIGSSKAAAPEIRDVKVDQAPGANEELSRRISF